MAIMRKAPWGERGGKEEGTRRTKEIGIAFPRVEPVSKIEEKSKKKRKTKKQTYTSFISREPLERKRETLEIILRERVVSNS